jgi:hypothetical protein
MTILIAILLGVICVMLGVIAWVLITQKRVLPPLVQSQGEEKSEIGRELREFTEQLREREARERDKELAMYAALRRRKQPVLNPVMSQGNEDRIHSTNPKAEKILIPEHLSEEEKETLRQFYNL